MSIDHFKSTYGLKDQDFLLIPYGSRVYGTNSENSDYDYLAIIVNDRLLAPDNGYTGIEYSNDNINITLYDRIDWQNQLNEHKIHTLEGYFHPSKLGRDVFKFKLNLVQLRHTLSEKAGHSFVKAKKKIEIAKEYYIGWKSLFHSLRILKFAIQVAKFGEIVDFSEANHYWDEIKSAQQYNWDYFKQKYQPEYNRLSTEFKKLAPKE